MAHSVRTDAASEIGANGHDHGAGGLRRRLRAGAGAASSGGSCARSPGGTREVVILLPARQRQDDARRRCVALHHLVTVPDAKVVVAAASRAAGDATCSTTPQRYARALGDPHVVHRYLELRWCDRRARRSRQGLDAGRWRCSAADARKLHGLTYSLAIVDELQAHADDVGLRGDGVRRCTSARGAQLVTISTAGQGTDSPLGQLRARALALPQVSRRGVVTDARGPGLRFLEWSLRRRRRADAAHRSSAPTRRRWITPSRSRTRAAGLPELAFRRFVANMWTARAQPLAAAGRVAAVRQRRRRSRTASRSCVGVDVGGERSATAVAWVTDDLRVGVWIGHGDEAVLDAARRDPRAGGAAARCARWRSTRGAPGSWRPSWSARGSAASRSRSRTRA